MSQSKADLFIYFTVLSRKLYVFNKINFKKAQQQNSLNCEQKQQGSSAAHNFFYHSTMIYQLKIYRKKV